MKPALQKSPISENQAFEVKHLVEPHFDPNWHFHSEYQIFVVLNGTGTRFIGDHVSPFKKGDLVFTGPNLPHLWQSDPEYFKTNNDLMTEGVVIYFPNDFLGTDLLKRNELFRIRQLFQKAERGMHFTGAISNDAIDKILSILKAEDFDRIIKLMELLNLLAAAEDYILLASNGYSNSLKESESDRMSRVHTYVMQNFREKITLPDVASIANMSPSSFSRYFKTHANKTFSAFLTEIRIGYSRKLLSNDRMAISQVCYDSGFTTLSNFNRQFKALTNYNPLEYRKKYSEIVSN